MSKLREPIYDLPYYPHPAQYPFHVERHEHFTRLISAATGGGKTMAGAYELMSWALMYKGSVGYAFEPNFKMVKRILIPTLQYPELLGDPLEANPLVLEYNKTDSFIKWRGGSTTWLIGLDEPENAEGPNVDYIWADEARLIHDFETSWKVWIRRLRGSGRGFPVGLWLTTTPDYPGSPLYGKFEDPRTRHADSKIYRWGLDDNPYLTEHYKREVRASHSGGWAERFIHGRFAAAAVGSFAFDYTIHVLSPESINMRNIQRVIYGVDFGWSNPSAIIAVGLDGDDRAFILDEFYQNKVSDEVLSEEAVAMVDKWGTGEFIADRSEPKSIEKLGKAGVEIRADDSKRDDGIRALGSRFDKQDDGRPRLYVSSQCVNTINELQAYRVEKKENDHAVDAIRYALADVGPEAAWVFGGG